MIDVIKQHQGAIARIERYAAQGGEYALVAPSAILLAL